MRSRRFVVLCLQGFGDALEATPLVGQLRQNVPSSEIVVVTMLPAVRDLYESLPALVDRVIYIPFWERGPIRSAAAFAKLMFATKSDMSFLTYPSARPEYALLARSIASRKHIAHDYSHSGAVQILGRTGLRVPVANKHNVLRNLDLLEAAGFPVVNPEGYIVPDAWRATRQHPARVLMHVGSNSNHGLDKRWPVDSFLELGRELERSGIEVVLLSGPAEKEETERVARGLSNATVFAGDLSDVAVTLSRVGAVVANDNGIAHLAAGVGTPVVALMGPTPPEFGPYGKEVVAYRPSACAPCFNVAKTGTHCALNIDFACLKRDIRATEVAAIIQKLLRPTAIDAEVSV